MHRRALLRFLSLACLPAGMPTRARAQAEASARDAQLIAAAARGDLESVERLLAQGAGVHARDAEGKTALNAAAHENRIAVARRLIAAGADVNAPDRVPRTPFMIAAVRGHLEILKLTLAAGADLGTINQYGGTALIPACHYGHVEVVRELLKTRIDVDHVNRLGWTALLEAVILGDGGPRHTEIVRLLLERGARREIADRDGVTPLEHARRRRYTAMVRLLETREKK